MNTCVDMSGCKLSGDGIYFATSLGRCASLGAQYVSRSGVYANSTSCSLLGGDVSGSRCNLDWCVTDRIVPGGFYIR